MEEGGPALAQAVPASEEGEGEEEEEEEEEEKKKRRTMQKGKVISREDIVRNTSLKMGICERK